MPKSSTTRNLSVGISFFNGAQTIRYSQFETIGNVLGVEKASQSVIRATKIGITCVNISWNKVNSGNGHLIPNQFVVYYHSF